MSCTCNLHACASELHACRCCSCGRYKDLAALNGDVGEAALALYCATVRATLFVCKGYECQEKEGVFMTAFPGPIKALEWAVTLQMALLRQDLQCLVPLGCAMRCMHIGCVCLKLQRHVHLQHGLLCGKPNSSRLLGFMAEEANSAVRL